MKKIIKILLDLVQDNQDFLCENSNLPKLAKIFFIINKLWNAGNLSFGLFNGSNLSFGLFNAGNLSFGLFNGSNLNYIKNFLSKIKYSSKRNRDLIYAAWNIHLYNENELINYDNFINLIKNGRLYSEFDIKYNKINKTFDDWVFLLTHNDFKYHKYFPNYKSVANHLLCLDNNGFFYNKNTGMICKTTGDIEIDIDLFSNWENSTLNDYLNNIIINITNKDICKIAINIEYSFLKQKQETKLFNFYHNEKFLYDTIYFNINSKSIILKLDEYTHPSYIKASYDICCDIILYEKFYKSKVFEFMNGEKISMFDFAIYFTKKWKQYIKLMYFN